LVKKIKKTESVTLENKLKENTKNDALQKQELPTARHKLPLNKKCNDKKVGVSNLTACLF